MTKRSENKPISVGKFFAYATFISIMFCLLITSQVVDFKHYDGFMMPFTVIKPLEIDCVIS